MPLVAVGGLALLVGATAFINWALPAGDAETLKKFVLGTISAATVTITSKLGWDWGSRSLLLTEAKRQEQHFQLENQRQCEGWGTDTFDPMNQKYNAREWGESDENASILETRIVSEEEIS